MKTRSLLLALFFCFSAAGHAQLSWSLKPLPRDGRLTQVVFAANKFQSTVDYYDQSSLFASSSNGITWNPFFVGFQMNLLAGSGSNHMVGADDEHEQLFYSSNGADWQAYADPGLSGIDSLCFSGGRYVGTGAVGKETTDEWGNTNYDYQRAIFYSNSALTAWTSEIVELPTSDGVWYESSDESAVAFGNNVLVFVTEQHQEGPNPNVVFYKNVDSGAWTKGSELGNVTIHAVRYLNGQFVAVGNAGSIFTSSDGASWTKQTSNTKAGLRDVAFGKNMLVAVGAAGTIVTSKDNGKTWVVNRTNVWSRLNSVTFGANVFVVTGPWEGVLRSN